MIATEEELITVEAVAQVANYVFTSSFWLFFALNIFLSAALSQIWNIFNTLQVIVALPLL